jgi:MFS family permease
MHQGTRTRYALWAVFMATAAVRVGFGAIMPVMPIYAKDHGLTTAMIAVMTNAYMIANALFQSYAGHLGDRWGRRPVMLVGTWLYTAAAALFMIDAGPWYYVALRGLEGLGACAFGPVVRAYVADLVSEENRGKAYGQLTSFDFAGLLFGPMLGGLVQNLAGPRAPFALCAVLGLLAGIPLLVLTRRLRHHGVAEPAPESGADAAEVQIAEAHRQVPALRLLKSPGFWAVALPGIGFAYLNAMYSVAWSIYMERIGATSWQISLSFTLFAVPMVLLMVPFGRLADRVGRPLLIAVGGVGSALATLTYGLLPYPWALIGFGVLDGAASAMFTPASQAFMADVSPRRMRGRFMGLVGATQTVATIAFVMLVGYLYDHSTPLVLFGLGAVALIFGTGCAVLIMLRRPAVEWRSELEQLEVA